jgi:HPt (histidine-containing phosphotransfer) domain-containing protein
MFIINVHAMKSALSNIGEKELSTSAFRLEQAGREKDINVLLSETSEFLEKLDKIIKEIKKKEEATVLSEDSEDALILLKNKLQIIKKACAEMEKKVIKNILSELREKSWSQKTSVLLSSIDEHLLHSDFDEASALIDEFVK